MYKYPYTAERCGIEDSAFAFTGKSEIVGGSGRIIKRSRGETSISFTDEKDPRYAMKSYADRTHGLRLQCFEVYTKLQQQHHPDFFAKAFITRFLEQLKLEQSEVQGIWAIWASRSTNLLQFNARIHNGLTPAEASLSTWTGTVCRELGYANIHPKISQLSNEFGDSIRVLFLKPEVNPDEIKIK